MADPIAFAGSNQVFKPAPGTEHSVRDLPCYYDEATGELIVCVRLSDAELAHVRKTGEVWAAQKVGYPPAVFPLAISGLPLMQSNPAEEFQPPYNSDGAPRLSEMGEEGAIMLGTSREALQIAGLDGLTMVEARARLENPRRFGDEDIITAKLFALIAHGAQRYSSYPYAYYLDKVDKIIQAAGMNDAYRCAAWLHDVVEDTGVNLAEIRATFGIHIGDLVWACSGFGVNRKERNADIAAKLLRFPKACAVKAADRIANAEATIQLDPERRMYGMYAKEAEAFEASVIPQCGEYLAERLKAAHAACKAAMEADRG